jgi:hypothetical protein
MKHTSATARDLRNCSAGRLTETESALVLHCHTVLHVIAHPATLQADPLFSRFYEGQRRTSAAHSCKEGHFKDGCVHLSINSRIAAQADEAFSRFMAPFRVFSDVA